MTTDAEALLLLPQLHLVRRSYAARRTQGDTPAEALQETLMQWREFQQDSRPAGGARSTVARAKAR